MDRVCRKSVRRLNGWPVPGTCWKRPVGWRSEYARCLRNRRRHLVSLDVRHKWPSVPEKKIGPISGSGRGLLPALFLVGVSDKDKRIFLERLHIFGCSIALNFFHQTRNLLWRHILGRLPEFIGEKPNAFAMVDFRRMV